jgi:hypothetical protein
MSNIDMVKRGKKHNNCVATYFDAHTRVVDVAALRDTSDTNEVSRIFFTGEATLELKIEYSAQYIVSTRCVQYKGRFNRDIKKNDSLLGLRIALAGMPTETLIVRKVLDDSKRTEASA